jgi:hypothetical protein
MARARFKEGVEFYDKSEYEQARAAFLQAYALKKHPAVLLNLAWSCLKAGHALEAEKYFKQFLAEGKEITDKQRADANDGLTQSRSKLGHIEVVAASGAEVTVDGDRVGTAPLAEPVDVEAGAHTVKIKAADGTADTQSVTVLSGEKAVARFGKSSAVPPPTPPPEKANPLPPSPPEPPSASATPAEPSAMGDQAPPKEHLETHAHGPLAPPKNIVPVIVAGGVTLAGAIGAVALGVVAKGQAQDKANSTAANIRAHGGTSCNPPTPANLSGLAQACNDFQNDNNDVNTDATLGNLFLGVAAAGALVAGIYWVVADKGGESAVISRRSPVLVPTVERSGGGLSLSGSF